MISAHVKNIRAQSQALHRDDSREERREEKRKEEKRGEEKRREELSTLRDAETEQLEEPLGF